MRAGTGSSSTPTSSPGYPRGYPSRIDYLRTERGVKPVRMENLNGCSSHATWTVHWLLIDSNRNYPADVVDSLGTQPRPFLAPSSSFFIARCLFSLFYRFPSLSWSEHFFLAVATRSSGGGISALYSSHARVRRRLHLRRVMYPFRKLRFRSS